MRTPLAAAVLLALAAGQALAGGGPAETVVLVNKASDDSRKVAAYYAAKRDIPAEQVCEVTCGAGLETSMDDFVRDVVDPLRTFLWSHGLEERCRFIVLTQGMPIRARTPGGDVSTAAALSLLDTPVCGQPQSGPHLKHDYTAGAVGTPVQRVDGKLYLVTALISTTAEEAMALVDRSVASDGTAPPSARIVFQDASGAANVRDQYYDGERRALEALGFATEHAAAGPYAVNGRERVIGYMSGGSYSALSVAGVNSNKYLPGAICDMLQSFGAVPVNFDAYSNNDSQFPITHMVRAGITGVHGAVQEPYNVSFPDWQLFRPYVRGFTLAETFHQRMPYVYWMNLTLGDPLCAPYARRIVPTVESDAGADGTVSFKVAAPGAARIDVYLDGRAAGSVTGGAGTVSVSAAAWPPAAKHRVLVETTGFGDAEPRGWVAKDVAWREPAPRPVGESVRARCEKIVVEAPASVRAGETFTVKATAADADGRPAAGWQGRLELRSSVPPVRWSRADAAAPSLDMPCRMTKAGDYELRVTAPGDGRETVVKIHVAPGPLHHATCPASSLPLCQEDDLEVVVEDEFGNRLTDWAGTISLEVPQDPAATLPAPATIAAADGGRGVLRGVVLTHPGPTGLVLKDGKGAVLSQQGEGVTVAKRTLRPWLVAGAGPAREAFASDVAAQAKGDGSVVARLPLRRRTDSGDVIVLPPGNPKGGEAAVLVTWIEAVGATKARLLAAAPGRLRICLDGKEVFDGTPNATDPKGKREAVANLTLAPGVHRLTVAAETRGETSASFEIDDGKGEFPPSLRVRAHAPEPAKK